MAARQIYITFCEKTPWFWHQRWWWYCRRRSLSSSELTQQAGDLGESGEKRWRKRRKEREKDTQNLIIVCLPFELHATYATFRQKFATKQPHYTSVSGPKAITRSHHMASQWFISVIQIYMLCMWKTEKAECVCCGCELWLTHAHTNTPLARISNDFGK